MAESFTALELDFLWEALDAGEPPYPLRVRSHGVTVAERAELRERTRTELAVRGILDHRGRIEPKIEGLLLLLTRAALSVDSVWLPELGAAPVRVLAGTLGAGGACVIQRADEVRLAGASRNLLAPRIVELLPEAPRGTEPSVTVPLADVAELSTPDDEELVMSTSDSAEPAHVLRHLARQPRLRGGQIGGNARDRTGTRRRGHVLSWFDTETGRYLSYLTSAPTGDWITVTPANSATLIQAIDDLLASLR